MKADFCLLQDARLCECVAPMAVFLPMQVAPKGERMSFFDEGRGGCAWVGGGYIATTIYSLYLGSCCNEMACVMEALSKQWAYSAQRAVSVRTGLNTIPLIQSCSHSSLHLSTLYSAYCRNYILTSFLLFASWKKCVTELYKEFLITKKNGLMCMSWKDITATVYLFVHITCVARRPIFRLNFPYFSSVIGFQCLNCC